MRQVDQELDKAVLVGWSVLTASELKIEGREYRLLEFGKLLGFSSYNVEL